MLSSFTLIGMSKSFSNSTPLLVFHALSNNSTRFYVGKSFFGGADLGLSCWPMDKNFLANRLGLHPHLTFLRKNNYRLSRSSSNIASKTTNELGLGKNLKPK